MMATGAAAPSRTAGLTAGVVDRVRSSSQTPLAVLVVVTFMALAVKTDFETLSAGTREAFLRYLAVPVVIGLAQMVPLAVGQLNLSVGALTGFCAMVTAWLVVRHGWPLWLALVACVAVGAVVGLVNGLLVVGTRINGFVVTLGTLTVLEGLRYGVNGTSTFQHWAPGLVEFGNHQAYGVPITFVGAALVAVGVAAYFRSMVSGRKLLACGGNEVAARLSGISLDRSVVVGHAISGLLVGVAAVLLMSNSDSVNSSLGDDLLLPSFAAPIIGGVAISGGVVSVAGTILAAALVRTVQLGRVQLQVDARWVDVVIGVVVLLAVLVGRARDRAENGR